MEAYLASIVNHTNRKMLAKLRFIYLFTFFIYLSIVKGGGTTQCFFS